MLRIYTRYFSGESHVREHMHADDSAGYGTYVTGLQPYEGRETERSPGMSPVSLGVRVETSKATLG